MSYISSKDFLVEVQKGNVTGHSMVHKFGRNDAVPNATWEMISLLGPAGTNTGGGTTPWPLSAATTVRVKAGGDVNDDTAGSGAREITVQGINDSFAEVSEAVATAGVSASGNTTASFWRVHRAWVSATGTYGLNNEEIVTIENSAGGTDLIMIGADEGQSQFGGFTIPAGKTGYLLSVHATVDTAQNANIRMYTRGDIDDTTAPMKGARLKLYWDGVKESLDYRPRGPELSINEKSDVWFEATASASTQISVDFELLLVDN